MCGQTFLFIVIANGAIHTHAIGHNSGQTGQDNPQGEGKVLWKAGHTLLITGSGPSVERTNTLWYTGLPPCPALSSTLLELLVSFDISLHH